MGNDGQGGQELSGGVSVRGSAYGIGANAGLSGHIGNNDAGAMTYGGDIHGTVSSPFENAHAGASINQDGNVGVNAGVSGVYTNNVGASFNAGSIGGGYGGAASYGGGDFGGGGSFGGAGGSWLEFDVEEEEAEEEGEE